MKKYNLLIVCLWLNINVIIGQQSNIIKTFEDKIKGDLSLVEGQLRLMSSNKKTTTNSRVILKNAQLENGDLIISFDLAEFRNLEKKMTLNIQPSISTVNGEILVAQPKFLEGNLKNSYHNKPQGLQLKWNDFQDHYRFGEINIMLNLRGQLEGVSPIDCNNPPIFGKQQKLLHYVIAGLSVGTVITGYAIENSSNNLYEQYRGEIFEGESDVVATTTYNKANTRNKAGGFLKTASYTVFGINAAVYAFRQIRYKKRKKEYDYYCEQKKKLSIQPYLNFQSENTYAGMQMAFQF